MADETAPAGWYGQPDDTERFWTGSEWSSQVRPRLAAPPPAPPAMHLPQPPAAPYRAGNTSGALVPMRPAPVGSLANPQLAYTQQGYVAVAQVAPKSPGLALLGSFFFPGLGQLINGQVGKGIAMFIAYLISLALIFLLVGLLLAPAVWVWSMIDAYAGAQQWNARHGILS